MTRAYSYVRFSDRRQMAGDSLRRQLKLTESYCERKGLFLDDSLRLRDLGVSGLRGKNADVGRLALFLEAIRQKRVPAGSVLIVENLDRISRDDIDEALPLFMGILKAGVAVVTLSPEREYTAETAKGSISVILEVVIAFALANEESRKKSERVREEWRERFNRLDEEKITARVPAWLRLRPDRKAFEFVPKAAAFVDGIEPLFPLEDQQ
jgi:DNA invertase Pin-like site-specific DNA recombinase